ncbi:MAG: NADH-quinone oxidoreductase subunit J [Acidimicrobiales bacterium]
MNAEIITFAVAATLAVIGALGVVLARNPVHSALFLVQTLFGVAVLFIAKEAYFLAAIQVIVYAGAIVILFLFVIMLVGVDRTESLEVEPVVGLRPLAVVMGAALLAGLVTVIVSVKEATGAGLLPIDPDRTDIEQLGDRLFTDWVFAFQLTGLLLTIAVVGAVLLARRPRGDLQPIPDPAPMVMAMNQAQAAREATADESGSSAGGGDDAEATDDESGSSAGGGE